MATVMDPKLSLDVPHGLVEHDYVPILVVEFLGELFNPIILGQPPVAHSLNRVIVVFAAIVVVGVAMFIVVVAI
eukprot:9092490-Karenia_brevis.AAC.1